MTSAAGAASRAVSVPNTLSLTGLDVFYQWIVRDAAANGLGVVTSNGGRARLGQ
jgi:hypothetical protein